MADHPVTTWKNRAERAERRNGKTRTFLKSPDDLRRLAREVASYPDGVYRFFLGEIRRQKRSLRLGKPVKRVVRQSVRRDSRDVKWSKAIRERDPVCRARSDELSGGIWGAPCVMRPLHNSEEAAHVVPRRFKMTRWLEANGFGLCRSTHRWFTDHPKEWEGFCRSQIGDAEYDRLWKLAHRVKE